MRVKFLTGQTGQPVEGITKKSLSRLINQIDLSRAAEFSEFGDEITISMIEWVYEYIFNKYGF